MGESSYFALSFGVSFQRQTLVREQHIQELLRSSASQNGDESEKALEFSSKISSATPAVSPEVVALELVLRREAAANRSLRESMALVEELKQQLSQTSQAVADEQQNVSAQAAAVSMAETFLSQQHTAHEHEIQVLSELMFDFFALPFFAFIFCILPGRN